MYPKEPFERPDKRMEKLDLLSDPKARKILEDCKSTSRSIEEISRRQGIPLNICHKIASVLEEFDLIREEKVVRKKERVISLYRTVPENTSVTLGEKKPTRIELEFSNNNSKLSMA